MPLKITNNTSFYSDTYIIENSLSNNCINSPPCNGCGVVTKN